MCGVSTASWGEAFVALVCIEQPHLKVSLLWRSGALSHRTSPPEISTRKSVNSGIHRRLLVHQLLLNPSSFTYVLYLVISILLDVLYLACYHLVAHHASIGC